MFNKNFIFGMQCRLFLYMILDMISLHPCNKKYIEAKVAPKHKQEWMQIWKNLKLYK